VQLQQTTSRIETRQDFFRECEVPHMLRQIPRLPSAEWRQVLSTWKMPIASWAVTSKASSGQLCDGHSFDLL
jgi:hypothetical protein